MTHEELLEEIAEIVLGGKERWIKRLTLISN